MEWVKTPDEIEQIMASGAEGVVAKPLDAPYGSMECYKALQIRKCAVLRIGPSQSVEIIASGNDEDVVTGFVKLGGGKVDKVRVGSLIKVESLGLTSNGKLREPRICTDTPDSWLVKY